MQWVIYRREVILGGDNGGDKSNRSHSKESAWSH